MTFFLHEFIHFVLALGVGVFCYWKFGNPWLISISLLTGFFIDLDHLLDYFATQISAGRKLSFSPRTFLQVGSYIGRTEKIYVPLHGWEYVMIFWFLGRLIGVTGLEWAISLPYFFHLLWDSITVRPRPLAYFLAYRLLNGFAAKNFDNGHCK